MKSKGTMKEDLNLLRKVKEILNIEDLSCEHYGHVIEYLIAIKAGILLERGVQTQDIIQALGYIENEHYINILINNLEG